MLWKDGYLMILPDALGLGIDSTHGRSRENKHQLACEPDVIGSCAQVTVIDDNAIARRPRSPASIYRSC